MYGVDESDEYTKIAKGNYMVHVFERPFTDYSHPAIKPSLLLFVKK